MPTVGVNPPKTPVTKGSMGIATATLPNVCKMPGPPAPFVPTPLPNIGMSGDKPQKYSTKVKIEGQPVAIRGSSFGSMGDIASQATGGGILSANAHGPTTFVGPGSLDVKIEGKNVQLLGDPMLNNCGPSGSPANAATLAGVLQRPSLLFAQAVEFGILAEVQEICDIHCECVAAGDRSQHCVDKQLFARDAATGFRRRTKSEVPYNMKTRPPSPYMSRNDSRRQTRNWRIGGSRRPDTVIVKDPSQPWSGSNIAAVVECKWGKDTWGKEQKKDYEKIAGGPDKLIEMNDTNCHCPGEEEPEPDPVPVPVPARRRVERPSMLPDTARPVAVGLAAVGLAALAVAAVASAPVVATAAAAVAVVGLLGAGATTSTGGGSDVI